MRISTFSLIPLLALTACSPLVTTFDDVEPAHAYEAVEKTDAREAPDELKVMTWNVKFAGGRIDFFFDCHGDRVLMTEDEVLANLEGLAGAIREVDPDVVLLQEVDVESKRAAYVDMLQYLLDHTDLNYGVYASQWRADSVPSDGLGRVDSGNAIMSRWPLADAERIALDLIDEQDALTRYFWLRRNVLRARIDFDERRDVWAVNVHTAAFAQDGTKKKHIDTFKDVLDALDADGEPFLAGGDLNTLPPGSEQTSGFDDSVCVGEFEADDYTEESDWLEPLYEAYEPAIPLSVYQADNDPFGTHTTDGDGFWNRKLDYLFTNLDFEDGQVLQSEERGELRTMPLSDHAPITATLELP